MELYNGKKSNMVEDNSVVASKKPLCRFKPSLLSDVVTTLTTEQSDWVKDTGFGPILLFSMKEYPVDISYFVLDCYQPHPSAFRLDDMVYNISEEDVYEIIGLPIGERDMVFTEVDDLVEIWANEFPRQGAGCRVTTHVTMKELSSVLKETTELNEQFKRNFVLLMSNILIEGSSTPYTNKKILGFTGNLDHCFEYNWCKHLLLTLQEEFVAWNVNREKNFFRGSIAFLIFYSVERLIKDKKYGITTFPSYVRWTDIVLANIHMSEFRVPDDILCLGRKSKETDDLVSDIIKKICNDIDQKFANDVEATPEILLTYLDNALDEYKHIQKICMEQLSEAKRNFSETSKMEIIKAKFISINEKAISFVSKRLVKTSADGDEYLSSLKDSFLKRTLLQFNKNSNSSQGMIWHVIDSDELDSNVVLFKWRNVTGCKIDFESMKLGEMILTSVIDVFCCFMNILSFGRPLNGLNRLFCFTHNTIGIVNAAPQIPTQVLYSAFQDNLEDVMQMFTSCVDNVDLIFFPMFYKNHHYVVCYNLTNPSVDILDNRKSENPVFEVYGEQLEKLHDHFIKYLEFKKHKNAAEIKFLVPERLRMTWQTSFNDVDCGVFAMRHMETYMGGGTSSWVTGFGLENYEQSVMLNNLRIHYLHLILTSTYNEERNLFLKLD